MGLRPEGNREDDNDDDNNSEECSSINSWGWGDDDDDFGDDQFEGVETKRATTKDLRAQLTHAARRSRRSSSGQKKRKP